MSKDIHTELPEDMEPMDDEEEDEPVILQLQGENGEVVEFELIGTISHEGNEYVAMIPADMEDDNICFLSVTPDPDDPESELFNGVKDEALVNTLYELFKEKYKDDFNFTD